MRRTPGLWHIVLALSLIVMYIRPLEQSVKIWDERLVAHQTAPQPQAEPGAVGQTVGEATTATSTGEKDGTSSTAQTGLETHPGS